MKAVEMHDAVVSQGLFIEMSYLFYTPLSDSDSGPCTIVYFDRCKLTDSGK